MLFQKSDWTVLQIVRATDQYGRRHQLELTFDLIYEDGPLGDNSKAAAHLSATVYRLCPGLVS